MRASCLVTSALRAAIAAFAAFAAVSLSTGTAFADEPPRPAAEEAPASSEPSPALRPSPSQWYGWQILLADTGVAGTIVLSAVTSPPGDGVLLGTAMAGFYVDGPLIHAAHHQESKVAFSVLLRLLLPAAGLGVGAAIGASTQAPGSGGSFGAIAQVGQVLVDSMIGIGAGMLTASIADSVVLGWGPASPRDRPDAVTPETGRSPVRIAPTFAFAFDARHDATPILGVAGSL